MSIDTPVTSLLELIASHDARYEDAEFHRVVYDHIERKIQPAMYPDARPPLSVLVYAIRNILEPSFLLQEIPNLLRLIAQLELIRQNMVSTMQRMLRDSDNAGYHRVLAQLTGANRLAAQRTVYRKIVNGCCLLHIHHLWRIYNPDKDPPLTASLINYFPTFVEKDPELLDECHQSLKTYPWHYGVTKDELAANRETGQRAAEFMLGASQYLDDPAAYCNDNEFRPGTPFDDIFPPPDAFQIVDAIMRYIKMVEKVAVALEDVLQRLDGSTRIISCDPTEGLLR